MSSDHTSRRTTHRHSPIRTRLLAFITVLACLMGITTLPSPQQVRAADNCLVTTTRDSGDGSLRAAMENDDCAAITFDLVLDRPRVINLVSSLPTIDRDLTIMGPGRDWLTIDGQNAVRPLLITDGAVTIAGLTIAHGWSVAPLGTISPEYHGGGIAIRSGTVSVQNARVRGSSDSGIYIGGGTVGLVDVEVEGMLGVGVFADRDYGSIQLSIEDSAIRFNYGPGVVIQTSGLTQLIKRTSIFGNQGSGVIIHESTASISDSTITGIYSIDGGGIWAYGGLRLANSVVSGNVSSERGGGVYAGFGLYNHWC